MEDSNLWYYLVLGIIYLLSRAFGKKKPKKGIPPQQGSQNEPSQESGVPDLSFEDLLRELSGGKKTVPPPIMPTEEIEQPRMQNVHVEPAPAYSVDDMDKIASAELRPTGTIDGVYDDEIKRERMKSDFTRDVKYKIEEYEEFDFTDILTRENGPAQAFIAQEIFSRKF